MGGGASLKLFKQLSRRKGGKIEILCLKRVVVDVQPNVLVKLNNGALVKKISMWFFENVIFIRFRNY